MVVLGRANSRMNDFHDIWLLSRRVHPNSATTDWPARSQRHLPDAGRAGDLDRAGPPCDAISFSICSHLAAVESSLQNEPVMADQIVITEKSSQAKDVRAAVGSRYGEILAAEGHLFDLLEPEDVVPAWKRWSPILLRPEGLYGTRPAEGGSKAARLRVIREALRTAKRVWLAHRLRPRGAAHRPGNSRTL
jgi:hypothetical protein